MTSEQIAELRRHIDSGEGCIDGKECAHGGEILRILDEREALLEAAKKAIEYLEDEQYNVLRAAIAKAEAP